MAVEIYYYSGTGNSLHVAKELQIRIADSKLLPVVSCLSKKLIKTNSETVGFVFPVYLTSVPAPIKEFLARVDLSSAKYIFAFLTREKTFYTAYHYIRKELKKQGRILDAFFIQNMINNSPTGIKPLKGDSKWPLKISEEKVNTLENVLQERLKTVAAIIKNKENFIEKGAGSFLTKILNPLFTNMTKNNSTEIKYFYDDTCTGCGICRKVCPTNRIKLNDGKPIWQKSVICYYCFACFNFCPEQAVLVKYYKDKNGRYHHPDVTMEEIAAQKE